MSIRTPARERPGRPVTYRRDRGVTEGSTEGPLERISASAESAFRVRRYEGRAHRLSYRTLVFMWTFVMPAGPRLQEEDNVPIRAARIRVTASPRCRSGAGASRTPRQISAGVPATGVAHNCLSRPHRVSTWPALDAGTSPHGRGAFGQRPPEIDPAER
jgi:hypothetical protein